MNVKQRTASDLMTREVVTIHMGESLKKAASRLHEQRVHCLLIPHDDPRRCVGIITVGDIVQVLCEGEPELLDRLLVQDVMTAPAVAVQKEFVIEDCIRLMRISGVRSVPVLDGTRVVGLLSFTDVLRALAVEAPAG